jgi:hypothetical protein
VCGTLQILNRDFRAVSRNFWVCARVGMAQSMRQGRSRSRFASTIRQLQLLALTLFHPTFVHRSPPGKTASRDHNHLPPHWTHRALFSRVQRPPERMLSSLMSQRTSLRALTFQQISVSAILAHR